MAALRLFLLVAFPVLVWTAPALKNQKEEEDHYEIIDQSQNGTENWRISVKDVVLIWAPADALLSASTLLDQQIFGSIPSPVEPEEEEEKPDVSLANVSVNLEDTANKTSSSSPPPEEAVVNVTTKPANMQRSAVDYQPTFLGSFLRRKAPKT